MNKKILTARPAAIVMILMTLFLAAFFMPLSGAGGYGIAYGGIVDKSDSFYVADDANVISAKTENYIVEKNAELEELCGGQIVVVTVDFLDGMDIEDYAYKLFDDWEIGDKNKNNGILLLLTIGEENYWCMQGKGLENSLTSGDIDDILWDYLEEDFAAGNYDAGVRSVFDALYTQVSAIYGGTASQSGGSAGSAGGGSSFWSMLVTCFIIFVVLMVILFIVATLKKRRVRASYYDAGGHDGYERYDGDPSPARPRTRSTRRRRRTVFIPVGKSRPPRPPRTPYNDDDRPGGGLFSGPFSGPSTFGRPSGGGHSRSSFGGGLGRGGGGGSRGGGAGRRH